MISHPAKTDALFEVKPVFGGEQFLWRCSPKAVAIVPTNKMDNYSLVDGFWDSEEFPVDKVDPICLVMNIKPEKILGLAIADGTKSILRTFEVEKKKFRTFSFNDYDKELNLEFKNYTVVSIEKSMRTNIFYAAVQSAGSECPRVQQVKIGSDGLLLSSEVIIEIQDFKVISRINGFQVGKTDYLLATGTNTVAVMKASKEKPITIIHVFAGIYSGLVLDICAFKNKFFCAGAESPFIAEIATQHNVEDKDLEAQEEILYEKYEVSKISVQSGTFDKIEMNKKGTSLYLIGKGISAINDIHLAKPQCSKPVNEGSCSILCRKTVHHGQESEKWELYCAGVQNLRHCGTQSTVQGDEEAQRHSWSCPRKRVDAVSQALERRTHTAMDKRLRRRDDYNDQGLLDERHQRLLRHTRRTRPDSDSGTHQRVGRQTLRSRFAARQSQSVLLGKRLESQIQSS